MVYFYEMIKFQSLALNLEIVFILSPISICFLARTMHFCLSLNSRTVKSHFEIVYFIFKNVKRDVANTKIK